MSDCDEDNLYGILEEKNIERVVLGNYEFDTWYGNAVYFSKDQETLGYKFANLNMRTSKKTFSHHKQFWLDKLYVCEWCFKYSDIQADIDQHRANCVYSKKLPGKIVYKSQDYMIRRVRGIKHKVYCQSLCLFAKLFLDNKSVYFALDQFEFYVVYGFTDTKRRESQKPMGFFSKEMLSWENNNLACILVFPPFQRRKLGHLLISYSYHLSKFEGSISGPEHPLSSFGKIGYLRYWSKIICQQFLEGDLSNCETVSFKTIEKATGFRRSDILMALEYMKVLTVHSSVNQPNDLDVVLMKGNMRRWAHDNNVKFVDVLSESCLIYY